MDLNWYLIERLVEARLDEARRAAARHALLHGLRPRPRPSAARPDGRRACAAPALTSGGCAGLSRESPTA